jgi:alpha-beta hydrolase superfamily lysophospholipase
MSEENSTTQITNDGTTIHIHTWSNSTPERVLVCIQGLGGHGGYYDVLAEALVPENTIVIAPDLRGHGHSHGKRGDIASFEPYLQDVDSAIMWARQNWPTLPLFLLGESMGSSIAIGYITMHPTRQISGLALVSPVLRATVQPSLTEVARGTRALLTPTRPLIPVTGREELGCRENAFNDRLRADPLFIRQVSMRFLITITNWLKLMQKRAGQVTLPLLVLQGEHDYVAHPAGTREFLRNVASKDVENKLFHEAYHCLFHDPATSEVFLTLNRWLRTHS